MKTSVITSSMNRKDSMGRLFRNLVAQTMPPDEIILVEAGGGEWTKEELPESLQGSFHVHYAPKESLAASRDRGQKAATGEVLFFFDDDIILPPNYIETALNYFKAHNDIMAVGGGYVDADHPDNDNKPRLMAKMLGVHADGTSNRLLSSGWTDYVRGSYATGETKAEWLFGCNFAVRATAFEKAHHETRMAAWSFLEDVFFGLSLKNAYGDCMRVLPALRVIHDPPESGGAISPITLRMRILYRLLLWQIHVPKTLGSRFMFGLGMSANLLLMLKQERRFWVVPETLKTLGFMIKKQDMTWEDANEFIFS